MKRFIRIFVFIIASVFTASAQSDYYIKKAQSYQCEATYITMAKTVKITQSEWFAIERERARQKGYYFVEELGHWSESDREIYLKYCRPMRILYIHGLSSSGSSGTADRLRKFLPDDVVFSPDLPVEPQEALTMLQELVEREQIDLVIGTSMGGMFAQKLRGCKKILVNPSSHVSRSMRDKLGINEFFSPRADGATRYEITEALCDRYEELERTQFDNLTDEEREITLGLFGTADDVVNCSEEYKQHYTRFSQFKGGHRLTENDIKFTLLHNIEQYRKQMLTLEVDHTISPLWKMRRL